MPYQANDQETCLFCLGEAEPSQPLKNNKKCHCKYSYHDACYARYDRKEICPLCKRKDGEVYIPQSSTPSQHITITITLPREATQTSTPYTILSSTPQQRPAQRKPTLQSFIVLMILMAIVIAIMVTIIMVV
jgi:hypothetical protein